MSFIHESHFPQARRATLIVAGIFVFLLFIRIFHQPQENQLSVLLPGVHVALEVLAITVSVLVFGVTWGSRRRGLPRSMVFMATAFLGVALLDFSHMMSYPGMPDYFTPGSADKAILFWLAARTLGAAALLATAWLPWREQVSTRYFGVMAGGTVILVAFLHWVFLAHGDALPLMLIEGQGLTAFKVGYEYVLMAIYSLAAAGFVRHMRLPRRFDASGFFIACGIMVMTEYCFTLFIDITGFYNFLGHILKVVAFVFLYRAAFVEMVNRPYVLLDASRRSLEATLAAMPDLVFEMDAQGRYFKILASRPLELSAPAEELIGRTVHEALPAAQARVAQQALDEAVRDGFSRGRLIALDTQDGQSRWFELSVAHRPASNGCTEGYVVISRDVSERRQSQQTLRKWALAVEQSTVAILIMDAQMRIEFVNQSFCRSSGYTAHEVLGRRPRFLYSPKNLASLDVALNDALARGAPWSGEILCMRKDGSEYMESMLVYPVQNDLGETSHYLAIKEDITERKQSSERIHQLANYDQLTGLPNRSQLYRLFGFLSRRFSQLALLWIDLDHFKHVNDALGHSTGDLLLLEMALRLRARLGVQDGLSRLSGDDFVILLPGADHRAAASQAQELLGVLAEPLELAGQTLSVSASIGIALYPSDADQAETLMQRGETAMYRAKEEGRSGYRFFQPEMQEQASRTLALGNALKTALARGELYLEYQPQLDLDTGEITGAEALLRWRSPQWGYVLPSEFIPIAEANGILPTIEEWVLRTALTQLRQWIDAGLGELDVAVNVSAGQFERSDLPDLVERMLADARVPPELLALELTEAIAMRKPQLAASQIGELRQRRIQLAIDDFGTGYSSLGSLKRFMISTIKIDQSFVRDINTDSDDQAITKAIISMARSLGMTTIAEGVETAQQLEFLMRNGCEAVQGYYISRSLLPTAFEEFVRAWDGIGAHRSA